VVVVAVVKVAVAKVSKTEIRHPELGLGRPDLASHTLLQDAQSWRAHKCTAAASRSLLTVRQADCCQQVQKEGSGEEGLCARLGYKATAAVNWATLEDRITWL